jgi:hypothetical protein
MLEIQQFSTSFISCKLATPPIDKPNPQILKLDLFLMARPLVGETYLNLMVDLIHHSIRLFTMGSWQGT